MKIVLEHHEMVSAALIGVMRQCENVKIGRKPAHGIDIRDDWQCNIEGAMGEAALAKHLNMFHSKGQLRDDDVGPFQVRTTSHDHGCLICHEGDLDEKRYYLVTGLNGEYNIRGWMLGKEAKQQKYWSDPSKKGRWAFFVPQGHLRPSSRKQT